jgi:antitoxin component YwqK of YwqJK toxin-antitoxin module
MVLFSQSLATHRSLTIKMDSGVIAKTDILNNAPSIKPHSALTYHYHHVGSIHQTQGGYTGNLLDGKWETTYPDRSLQSQGQFDNGLKTGTWRYWHPNGRLQKEDRWKTGQLHGAFFEYDEDGNLLKRGNYRKGRLHGLLKVLENGRAIEKTWYRKGEPTGGFWDRFRLRQVKRTGQ